MKPLHIFLLGQPRIIPSDSIHPVKLTRSCLSLLAYLLIQPRQSISRERILDTFWGEHSETRARSCLNSALWRLRNTLGATGSSTTEYVLSIEDGQISFNWQCTYWYDVELFEQLTAFATTPPAEMTEAHVRSLTEACTFYSGELLEGYYEDWALRERERLRRLYLASLSQLMEYYSQCGEHERSLSFGHQLLELDPLREDVHRAMIRLYMQSGQRVMAIQQFERCRKALEDELGVEPMEETLLLYGQICDGTGIMPINSEVPPINYQQALRELKLAHKRIDELSTQIHRTIYLLEQCRNTSSPSNSSPS